MKQFIITVILLACLAPLLNGQTTWHVATNGIDTNTGLDWSSPYLTISQAVQKATSGDMILVSNGVYETSNHIAFYNAVHLHSVNGPEVTTVSGAGNHRIFQIVAGQEASISGFTITNGYTTGNQVGAGLHIGAGVVSNCVITGNINSGNGGGVYLGDGLITHCRIYGNSGSTGGGIYSLGGRVSHCHFEQNTGNYGSGIALLNDAVGLYDSVLSYNQASGGGGGIYINNSTSMVYNCQVYSNTVTGIRGGGIYVNNSAALLENIAVFGNRTESDDGINYNGGGGIWCSAPSGKKVVIRNALIYNNYSHESGGGIFSYNSSMIESSTIVSNYAAFNSGKIYGGGGGIGMYNQTSSTNMVRNCIIQFNACA